MIALNHASNVVGTLLPTAEIGALARQRDLLLVDAAQTAGACPIDMVADQIDLLAFTGHKALFGPMGTGGLVIGERVNSAAFRPLKYGGTGSRSEHERQPEFLPDLLESGTPNAVGLAGLEAGIRWVQTRGVAAIRAHEIGLTQQLIDGLRAVSGVTVYGTMQAKRQTAVVSFNVAGLAPSEVGLRLDEGWGVLCRVGLHCAPAAHRTLMTFVTGTVRFSLSVWNTAAEVQRALEAVQQIAQEARQ